MSYITENLMAGEKLVHSTRLHWIVFAWPFVLVLLAVWMLASVDELVALGAFFFLLGLAMAASAAIARQSSEFGVTNRRVLIKTGLIRRRSLEVTLGKIESVQVDQGILGRVLNFGTIIVAGSGGTPQSFQSIAAPMVFRSHVSNQVEQRSSTASVAEPRPVETGRNMRDCPHCAEQILARANVCKHCGRDVVPIATAG
jgi:uncharacterized membrane protein YdbT with pleckstrin-like domain